MIRTKFAVEEIGVKSSSNNTTSFNDVSSRWQQQEWVKYLYEHGKILKVDNYNMLQQFITIFEVTWELPEKKKTYLLLKWSEQLDKTFK